MVALSAARLLLQTPDPDPAELLPLLARAARLEASVSSCMSSSDRAAILIAVVKTLPAAAAFFEDPLSSAPTLLEVLESGRDNGCSSELAVDAYCVLCLHLLLLHSAGRYPAEPLLQQLFAVGHEAAAPPAGSPFPQHARLFLLELLATAVPMWSAPIDIGGGRVFKPSKRKMQVQAGVLEVAAALEPDGARRGDIMWRLGASYHIQLTEPSLPKPEGGIEKARAALLGAARLLPPGSALLRNVYLRLACLVVMAAGGSPTAPSPGRFGCALSGAEAGLFAHWLGKARGARATVLAAHAARWRPSGDRAENDQLAELLHAHEAAITSARVCTCAACRKQCAAQRCARCLTIYCSEACQKAAWGAHKGACKLLARAAAQMREMGEQGGREALDEDVRAFLGPGAGRLQEREAPAAREVD